MPSASTYSSSNRRLLNASDFTNPDNGGGLNVRRTAVIHHVEPGLVGMGADQKEQLICDLVSRQGQPWPKKLNLSPTRNMAMIAAFGDDYSQWPGKAIEIWAAPVMFGGKLVPGIHVGPAPNGTTSVRPAPAPAQPAQPPSATAVAGTAPVAGPTWTAPRTAATAPIEDDEIPF